MNPLERALNILAPDDCLGCQQEGAILCQECTERLVRLPAICHACGKLSRNYRPCPKCINRWSPEHAWLYAAYKNLAADLVQALKFEQNRAAAQIMATLLDECLPYFDQAPIVSYVPTAPDRRRERGFDQAQLIAKELAKLRGWHMATLLRRQKRVRQLGSSRTVRRAQLKGAFRLADQKLINDKHILLVDDVVTTGATIEACAQTLLKAGALVVDAAAFAYTPKNK